MGTGLILKPWSDGHSKSRFNLKTCKAFQTFSTKNGKKTCLVTFGTTKQQNTIFSCNKQHKNNNVVLLSENFDHTAMMRSALSTFLPTLGLIGAVLKKIRLKTHKKHQKTQKIYSKDLWHCKGHNHPVLLQLVGS